MFIYQESYTFNTANPRHNIKIMFSASFSLASVWLVNPIKICWGETRVGSGVNIGYVSVEKMARNVVNEANKSFWSSGYIWFYTWFSITAGVSLIFLENSFQKTQKSAVFRRRSVKKAPNGMKPCETFELLH